MPPHVVGRSALACERRVGRVRTNQVCGPPYVWGGKCLPTQWGGRRSVASAGWESTYLCMGRQMPPHAVGRSALACERRVGRATYLSGLRATICMGRQMPPHAVGRSALACERRVGRVRTNQVCGPPYVWGGKCLPTQWGGRRSLASAGWGEYVLIRFAGHPMYGAANASPRSGEVGARLRAPGGESTY